MEYAYGDTPFYSLSKALLNKYTQIMDRESPKWCKVLSICPGNFESSMSTTEEENTFKDPMVTAEAILKVALNAKKYQGGKFYRYGEEIEY
jgi:NAD(P)-dependent dehydrogenase (short-subunit alcohol dehydrogenase family)